MEFKKLEIKDESNVIQRIIKSQHFRKTFLYIFIGAIAGTGLLLISTDKFTTGELIKNALLGGFMGFFITNSPCARGRC